MLLYLARIIHTYTCRLRGSIIVASSYFQFVVTVSLFLANYAFVQRAVVVLCRLMLSHYEN